MIPFHSAYHSRQTHAAQLAEQAQFSGLIFNPGRSLYYLTGLQFHLMERPVVAILSIHSEPVIILPELEMSKLTGAPYPLRAFSYSDDPSTWAKAFHSGVEAAQVGNGRFGVESTSLRVLELRYLEQAAPEAGFESADEILCDLRICKSPDELWSMRKAVAIAQSALTAILPAIKPGVTEKELASELTMQLLRAGSLPEMPFSPIVASGPNSANPHAAPSDRAIAPGDLLLFDWGASCDGYISDLTRTFVIGKAEPELAKIAEIVQAANAAGCATAGPGVAAEAIDLAARRIIENAGYGKAFFHRTGHGIGLDAHETPYIRQGNRQPLRPGMTFTVEPGIYLSGIGGVRIEDNVAIHADGAEVMSNLPRSLETLG
jgi:Xaa-Pro dipeptidase